MSDSSESTIGWNGHERRLAFFHGGRFVASTVKCHWRTLRVIGAIGELNAADKGIPTISWPRPLTPSPTRDLSASRVSRRHVIISAAFR